MPLLHTLSVVDRGIKAKLTTSRHRNVEFKTARNAQSCKRLSSRICFKSPREHIQTSSFQEIGVLARSGYENHPVRSFSSL